MGSNPNLPVSPSGLLPVQDPPTNTSMRSSKCSMCCARATYRRTIQTRSVVTAGLTYDTFTEP
eukprot:2792374-Amphidinium_carterae.1